MMVELADVAGAEMAFTRREHAELRTGLERLHDCARRLVELPRMEPTRLMPICRYLAEELMPHVAWEGAVIFPEIDEVSSTTWPTRLMRFDHVQINRAALIVERDIERICHDPTTTEERLDAYDHLVGLEALIRAHLDREETFVMPILEGRNH